MCWVNILQNPLALYLFSLIWQVLWKVIYFYDWEGVFFPFNFICIFMCICIHFCNHLILCAYISAYMRACVWFFLVHLELLWRILPVWENATIFQIRSPLSSGTIFFLYQLTWNSATIFNKVVAEWQVITKILTSLLLYELWTNLLHVYCCRIDLRLSFVGLCHVQIGAGTLVAYEW